MLGYALGTIVFVMFVIVLIMGRNKILVIEMAAVIQITHIALTSLDAINPFYKSIHSLWISHGINIYQILIQLSTYTSTMIASTIS